MTCTPHELAYVSVFNQDTMMVEQKLVRDLKEREYVMDNFGSVQEVHVGPPHKEMGYQLLAQSGEPCYFGESHVILGRVGESAIVRMTPVKGLEPTLIMVRLLQKKLFDVTKYFENVRIEKDKGFYLEMENVEQMVEAMRAMAFAGMLVQRRPGELHVILEPKRPTCYAMKLINGNFDTDKALETLDSLLAGAVVQPCFDVTESLAQGIIRHKIIHEGATPFTQIMLPVVKALPSQITCRRIERPNFLPIETTWFQT